MFKISATNDAGKTLVLSPSTRFKIVGVSGLLPPTATINSSTAGTSDGAVFNSSRLEARNIILTILPNFPVDKNRLALYDIFRMKRIVTIHYSNDQRDVQIDGYVESVMGDLFARTQAIQVSILCLDPYLKSVNEIVDDLSTIIDSFEFPFYTDDLGVIFSEIARTITTVVTNSGEANTGLVIELESSNEVQNPVVYDATNVTSFGLNFMMQTADKITIDTRHGRKSVILTRNGQTINLINYLAANPTWFSISPGETVFTYSADSNLNFLRARFSHYDLYEGV